MRAGHGLRSRTRDLFARPFLTKVYIPLSTYLRTYKIGDYVDVKVDGAIHKGMSHKVYHGRTGSVWNVTKGAIGVEINKQGFWHYSQTTGKRTGLIDTLTLVRSLEGQSLPFEQVETVSLAISMAVNATLDEVSDTFVKKADQEIYACNSQHEMDKVRASKEGLRSDLRNELNVIGIKIDKLADVLNARLEANEREFRAEIGTTRAEIGTARAELIAKLEGARYDLIKYFVGTVISVSAFSAVVIRYFVM